MSRPARWLFLFLLMASSGAASAGDGLVALQTAESSCPSSSGRYVNCNNGTVTDNETGLVWLANASCFGILDWFEAMAAVAGLSDLPDDGDACDSLTPDTCDCGLSDGSSPGEWRLPSIEEWETMVEYADDVLGCIPKITTDSGNECYSTCDDGAAPTAAAPSLPCSFYGVRTAYYWSSSTWLVDPSFAWELSLGIGSINKYGKDNSSYVWPLRGGQ